MANKKNWTVQKSNEVMVSPVSTTRNTREIVGIIYPEGEFLNETFYFKNPTFSKKNMVFATLCGLVFVVAGAGKNVTITTYGAQSGGLEHTVVNTKVSIAMLDAHLRV